MLRCLLAAVCVVLVCGLRAMAAEVPLSFEKDVRPILKAMCFQCHGEEEKPKGKLDVRLVRLMQAGGKHGPAVVTGKPAESPLWERIETDEMPEGAKKLTAKQKTTIKTWIEQGAKTLRAEPADVAEAKYSEEELNHWAFLPVRNAERGVRKDQSIDSILLAKLKENGITGFSAEADRRTFIRRMTFDLHGLPPTPEEVDAFVKDASTDAYEKLVARLLASPRYGERWGRHWLDVAGYAETDGNPSGKDHLRPHAWKYRDYVINSFNTDKPYNRFLKEQLAGDEMAKRPLDPTDPATIELLTASGFLRLAPDTTEATDTLIERNQTVANVVQVAGSAFLGLTVGCAQCHDHRYDPVSHEDYHRFRAIFDPAFDLSAWKKPSARVVDSTTTKARAEADKVEAEAKQKEKDIEKRKTEYAKQLLEKELAKVPEAERKSVTEANHTDEKKRSAEQKALLEKYRTIKTVAFITANLEEIDRKEFQKFEDEKKAIAKLRATALPLDLRMVPHESADYKGVSKLYFRGDVEQPKQTVTPAELFVLVRHRKAEIPAKAKDIPTTGRRLRYAETLTDGTHPLTARVIVNRVWAWHFGKGIVGTPGDFGLNGERPTHPELLDFLAAKFMADGWSLKKLHTLILTSKAYRQQSKRTPGLDRLDPDNRMLGRMTIRRLEAEAVRDSLLAVSGVLNPEAGGPSVPTTEDYVGRGIIGIRELSTFGKPYGGLEKVSAAQENRRSVYIAVNRTMPLSMLETFDLPVMAPNCDARKCSTVPPQSLMFLNDTAVVKHAGDLTERLWKDGKNMEERLKRLFALLYAAEPTKDELTLCSEFLTKQAEYFRTHGDKAWLETVKKWDHAPDMRAMESLCQTLLSANRFLYVD
jgi:Protein of unknown function (DUF1553)/Protein of unknown function (DUF1549)/Planctomycete cytochrome C